MFHPLPFATFGEVAHLGLEAHVSCSRCYSSRRISLDDDRLRARQFAGTRFRCTNERWNGEVCGGLGSLKIQPAELLPVGGANTLTYLWCDRCMPPWQIDQVQLDKPPWSDVNLQRGDRFRCPACRGRVDWHIHGPAWRPTYSRGAAATLLGADRPR
jgi:hypothetical protein